jgi:hypothetical protein
MEEKMLTEQYSEDFLRRNLLPLNQWQPFPPAKHRTAWDGLQSSQWNDQRKRYFVQQAEQVSSTSWPPLPATLYMEFMRTGDRQRYETPYFERRQTLATLVFAECAEYKQRFMDEIINGVWSIIGEPTWCIPAHAERYSDDPLPRQDRESVDLFACETAMILAESYYLLQEELETLSHSLCERIRRHIFERVIIPVETREDFHWLSGENNWSPWCASNVLGAAMYLLDDVECLASLTYKLMGVVDRFIANYGDDGGCDEGPGYWGVAAGSMLILLELLYSRSNGKIDIYHEPLIRNMGRFIVKAHLVGPWFMNFADAPARLQLRCAITYRYGERIHDEDMKNLALSFASEGQEENDVSSSFNQKQKQFNPTRMLREIFWMPSELYPREVLHSKTAWFPDLQVLVTRESREDRQGFVLAAKGGHNGENHNHNDVGQFIIFLDGQPGIIDIGVETYSRKTFSESRYDIWCIRSSGHNVPLVNGIEQSAGQEFHAKNVSFIEEETSRRLAMNLEDAYSEDAGLRTFCREFTFYDEHPAHIHIRDSFECVSAAPKISIPMYCMKDVFAIEPGKLNIATEPRQLILIYNPDELHVAIETIVLQDPKLRTIWGNVLHKIVFTYREQVCNGTYEFVFQALKT